MIYYNVWSDRRETERGPILDATDEQFSMSIYIHISIINS